jgi:peptide/nickel transport system ATP-binding protein/oligopeptide transport system ATP-binding protein
MTDLLTVKNITKEFQTKNKGVSVKAVSSVSFSVKPGTTLGIVGESGCGKSTLGRLILRLLKSSSGSITFDGVDLDSISDKELRGARMKMQMVFQDPFSSLNPRQKIADIIREPLDIHKIGDSKSRNKKVAETILRVGLPLEALDRYPHEFSGGQRQRICIARAIILNPKLVVADEPVSALDVSIQSQILNLLTELKRDLNLTYIFISHNLSVIRHISDVVGVMYLGEIVEMADSDELFNNPQHPYTKALLSAVPQLKSTSQEKETLQGDLPSPFDLPSGCTFHPRCPVAMDVCAIQKPALLKITNTNHEASCHLVHPDLVVK